MWSACAEAESGKITYIYLETELLKHEISQAL
jgi:hypothetical protein